MEELAEVHGRPWDDVDVSPQKLSWMTIRQDLHAPMTCRARMWLSD